jgi:hypothetical protein
MTTKRRKSRKGIGKGIPKPRTVFGRRRFHENGDTYIIELHTDGVHVRKLYSREVRPKLRFDEIVTLTTAQLELISAGGEADAERQQESNAATKKENANGDQEKGQQTQDPTSTQTSQAVGSA